MSRLYGRRAAKLILTHQKERISKISIQKGTKFSSDLEEALQKLSTELIEVVEREEIEDLAQGGVHQGIVLHLSNQQHLELKDLIKKSLSEKGRGLILVLDQVSDPHNLGAIIRAAESFGVDGIVLTGKKSASLTEVAKKSSAGASEFIPLTTVTNLNRALEQLKKAGFWIVGTALDESSENLRDFSIDPPFVIVLGSEGKGMRELTKKSCDYLVQIPMSGVVESLNVSQAASVVLWELYQSKDRDNG